MIEPIVKITMKQNGKCEVQANIKDAALINLVLDAAKSEILNGLLFQETSPLVIPSGNGLN